MTNETRPSRHLDEEAAKTSPDREAARAELLAAKILSTWTEKKYLAEARRMIDTILTAREIFW